MNKIISLSILFALSGMQSANLPCFAGDAAVDAEKAHVEEHKAAHDQAKAQQAAAHGHPVKAAIDAHKAAVAAAKAKHDRHKEHHDSH